MRLAAAALALAVALLATEPGFVSWVQGQGGRIETRGDGGVTAIALPYSWVTDADIEPIVTLRDVQRIDLSLSLITDAGMERLKVLENVTDLNLFAVEHITDTAIAYIRGWRKLERLNLRGTDITDTTLEYIGQISSLRSLDISYTQITNTGLEFLSSLPNLEEVVLGGNKVTGAGLRVLKMLPALRSVSLTGAQKRNSGTWAVSVTDLDLDSIGTLKGLRTLNLAGLKLTDAGVARLQPLAHLEGLDLSRTEVSSAGLQKVHLGQIKRLALYRAKRIDDSVADALTKAESLAVLDLSETAFGDAGLKTLSGRNSLKQLYLRGSRVTADGVAAFRAAHPSCMVSWE